MTYDLIRPESLNVLGDRISIQDKDFIRIESFWLDESMHSLLE